MASTDREALIELVEASTFATVDYYELSARTPTAIPPGKALDETEDEPRLGFGLKVAQDTEHATFVIRLRCDVVSAGGEVTVDAGAIYDLDSPREVHEDLMVDFAEEVGAMALLPYIRERVHSLSMHLGFPVVLPTIQRGQLRFSEKPGEADS